jgi:signal transduction histidine kinase
MNKDKKLLKIVPIENDLLLRASHELKTPLISIYNVSQILLKAYSDQMSEKVLEYVEIIHKNGQKLTNLIESLLDISSLRSNKMNLNFQTENIVKIIRECKEDIMFLAKERNLVINLDLPQELYLKIDRIKFELVITILLSNVIKCTPPKGTIFINLLKSKDFVDICIKDTGVGITENEKNELFQKFRKIKRNYIELNISSEGSGLGLYLTKQIVELHGGNIRVESEGRNKGSVFIIKLPI